MFRNIFFIIGACMVLTSCQKEVDETFTPGGGGGGGSSTYYIRGKLDGVDRTFNGNAIAIKTDFATFTSISLAGGVTAGSEESVNFTINNTPSGNPIVAGTYSESSSTSFLLGAIYVVNASVVYAAGLQPNPPNPFTITFSELTSTSAKGTFSGDIYDNNGFGPGKKTFTNGEFNLKF